MMVVSREPYGDGDGGAACGGAAGNMESLWACKWRRRKGKGKGRGAGGKGGDGTRGSRPYRKF